MTNKSNPAVDLVIETLAVYRGTKLLQQDSLPPLPRIRERLIDHYGATPWSQLVDCPWCLSVWVAGLSRLVRAIAPRFWRFGATVLASSAVAGLISEWLDNIELPETAMEAVESMERATGLMNEAADRASRPRDMTRRSETGEDVAARFRSRLPRA